MSDEDNAIYLYYDNISLDKIKNLIKILLLIIA